MYRACSYDGYYDDQPDYQGPVERVDPEPELDVRVRSIVPADHPFSYQSGAPSVDGMGFIQIIPLLISIAKIISAIVALVKFIKNIIKGSLLKALLSIVSFVLPVFSDIMGELGLTWIADAIDKMAAGLEGLLTDLLGDVAAVVQIPDLGIDVTSVFDSVSSLLKIDIPELDLAKMTGMDDMQAALTDPEAFAEMAVDRAVEERISEELDKTPLGRAINKVTDAEKFAEEAIDVAAAIEKAEIPSLDDIQADVDQALEEKLSEAADVKKLAEAKAREAADLEAALKAKGEDALDDAASRLEPYKQSLEDRVAKITGQLDVLKPPKLSLDDVLGFLMQYLMPGQLFSDLPYDQQQMMLQRLYAEFPGFEFPDFDWSMLDGYSRRKRFMPYLIGGGLFGSAALMMLFVTGED